MDDGYEAKAQEAWERYQGLTHPEVTALIKHPEAMRRAHRFGFEAGARTAFAETDGVPRFTAADGDVLLLTDEQAENVSRILREQTQPSPGAPAPSR